MNEKITTIEGLAEMIGKGFAHVDKEFGEVRKEMKAGFDTVFQEIDGLRDDLRQERGARRIEYADLLIRIEKLEGEVATLKGNK